MHLDTELAERRAERLVQRFGLAAGAAREKSGLVPFRRLVSAISVNWLTTSAAPPTSSTERSKRPSSFSKIRRRAIRPARRSAASSPSSRATPSSTQRPDPTSPTTSPSTTRARRRDALDYGSQLPEVFDALVVVLCAGLQRAGELVVAVRLGLRGRASRASDPARSARSRPSEPARAWRGTHARRPPSAGCGSTRSRAPRGSTPCAAPAAWPSRGRRLPERLSPFRRCCPPLLKEVVGLAHLSAPPR